MNNLPHFLVPVLPGGEDTRCMDLRVDYMERLYRLDNRQDPKHEYHSTYTGLLAKYGRNEEVFGD